MHIPDTDQSSSTNTKKPSASALATPLRCDAQSDIAPEGDPSSPHNGSNDLGGSDGPNPQEHPPSYAEVASENPEKGDPEKLKCTCPHPATETPGSDSTQTPPDDPYKWAKRIAGGAAVAVAAPTVALAGAAVVLPAIGFTSAGVAAGSLAAGAQSLFYGAATGGVFSALQSAGATIVAPTVLSTAAAASSAISGGVAIASTFNKDGPNQDSAGPTGGQNGTEDDVMCECTACVCADDCLCECKRRKRGKPRTREAVQDRLRALVAEVDRAPDATQESIP